MDAINATQLLDQLDKMRASAGGESNPIALNSNESTVSFADLMKSELDQVNSAQKEGASLSKAFELGDPDVSLAQVMISMQKASIQFQAVTEVRNKLLGAYQEIMSMQV